GAKVYVVDDAELERVKNGYPCVWKDLSAAPKMCFLGCPHMTLEQLKDWTDKIEEALKDAGNEKVLIPTVITMFLTRTSTTSGFSETAEPSLTA
ncbi:MAG: hypothetical protein J6U27_03140, partial [Spirochaetales bacterium]|nr:hypothetical protein [Spirochaetales bacterium]